MLDATERVGWTRQSNHTGRDRRDLPRPAVRNARGESLHSQKRVMLGASGCEPCRTQPSRAQRRSIFVCLLGGKLR
jgi:hypothetical protein